MVVWALWHFCAQVFGVLSLDLIKANQFAPSDKKFDRAYSVLLMTIINPLLFGSSGTKRVAPAVSTNV
jgi:hypothetical protein